MNLKPAMFTAVVAMVLGGCGGVQPEHQSSSEDDRLLSQSTEIINGTIDDGHPSVGLVFPSGCTGTLIGRRTVLTAAHCVDSQNQPGSFCSNGTCMDGTYAFHPNFNSNNFSNDVSVLRLASDFQAASGIRPSPIATSAPFAGLPINIVGFGCTQWGTSVGYGVKRQGWNEIDDVDSLNIKWDNASARICQGDSGGPAFWGNCLIGVHSHRLTSSGGSDDVATRVDVAYSWIRGSASDNSIRWCGQTICGDGYCDAGEDNLGCSIDCLPVCGNLVCETNEEVTCSSDCAVCGNGNCELPERGGSCDVDCGYCGDGICQYYNGEPWDCMDCM
ncbi:S1 family peptidase [Myxococcus sp. MISCRS1]|uniref:S1 family peptidase n=1 Tax=Myxococcus sp. MISCRS1 TaxID=2996786 RepID=UPI00226EB757|nr:S1 family peptidase [Myxococcus sp. MISCRS1]MCY1002021.1 S1 family peptidase [Myxococcus sp. MISCRS1]